MKKNLKKLKLNKETLRKIDTDSLQVAGAATGHETCLSWCYVCYTKEKTICNC